MNEIDAILDRVEAQAAEVEREIAALRSEIQTG